MALASTSATAASAAVLKTPFLGGARRALANAASVAGKAAPRRALVVEAKKSWIPAVKSDLEIINPPWLDGS